MPITEAQRQRRRRGLGASDSPAIMGYDPFRSPVDVWVDKTQDVAESPPNATQRLGNTFEHALIAWAANELDVKTRRNAYRVSDDGICFCHHDALVRGRDESIEAKTVTRHSPHLDAYDAALNAVPDSVIIQAHHQMYVSKLKLVWVPVLLVDTPVLFSVERNDELIDVVRQEAWRFWEQYVVPHVRPEYLGPPSLDVLRRVRREPAKTATVPEATISAFLALQAEAREAQKRRDEAQARLLEAMGDAEAAVPDTTIRIQDRTLERMTYFGQSRRDIDAKRLRAERPEIAAEYERQTTFRVLRSQMEKQR